MKTIKTKKEVKRVNLKSMGKKSPEFCNCGISTPKVSFIDKCSICGGKVW